MSRITSSVNLLTGLMVCGRCGARMHYQSWGKKGHKICCYSQQTSKPYLIRDPGCTQPSFWKEDIESLVIQDIFRFTLKQPEPSGQPFGETDAAAVLEQRLKKAGSRLKRLYRLYASDENDLLLETIQEAKHEYLRLEEQLKKGQSRQARLAASPRITETISRLSQVWDILTPREQKNIVHILVEKIVIDGSQIQIHYRI